MFWHTVCVQHVDDLNKFHTYLIELCPFSDFFLLVIIGFSDYVLFRGKHMVEGIVFQKHIF